MHTWSTYMHTYIHTRTYVPIWLMRDLRRMPRRWTACCHADLSGLTYTNSQKIKKDDFSVWNLNLTRIRFQVCFRFSMCRFYTGTDFRRPRQWNPWTVFATFPKLTAIISVACIFCKIFPNKLRPACIPTCIHEVHTCIHTYIHAPTYLYDSCVTCEGCRGGEQHAAMRT